MTNDREQRHVVLVFGEPGHGKSHLAEQLQKDCGYYWVKLDEAYVEFVRKQYPDFDLSDLRDKIKGHWEILVASEHIGMGIAHGYEAAWREHVLSLVESASREHHLVVVEGYLLLPALAAVQERLAAKAVVTTVEARYRQYFVASSIEQILGRDHVA